MFWVAIGIGVWVTITILIGVFILLPHCEEMEKIRKDPTACQRCYKSGMISDGWDSFLECPECAGTGVYTHCRVNMYRR